MAYKLNMTGEALQNFLSQDFALSSDKVDYYPNSNNRTIPANADLNSPEYCLSESFTVITTDTASSLINCPTLEAFTIFNFYLLGNNRLLPNQWCYCTRILINWTGEVFTQTVNTSENNNGYYYSSWIKYSYTVIK